MHAFEIRPADVGDVSLILSFIRELAAYEKRSHEVVANEALLREHLFGARPVGESLLAFAGDAPAGFALFYTNFSTFVGRPGIHLEDVFVRPEFRGQGLGRSLFLRVARLAWERQCGRLDWTVLDWNEPALRFYEGLGARVLPDWRVCRVDGEDLQALAQGRGA